MRMMVRWWIGNALNLVRLTQNPKLTQRREEARAQSQVAGKQLSIIGASTLRKVSLRLRPFAPLPWNSYFGVSPQFRLKAEAFSDVFSLSIQVFPA
jgi:hypothetical protein